MMKPLNEYELTKESSDEIFGFTVSCFLRNGIVWNEYYISTYLTLNQINQIFYIDEDRAINNYGKLPLAYRNDDANVNVNNYIMYSPKYKSEPYIVDSEFMCNIDEYMEVEAIHIINDDGNLIDIDVAIDHANNIIYITNDSVNALSIVYFDNKKRMYKSELIINNNIESLVNIEYDDENLESIKKITDEFTKLELSSIYTKYDNYGRKLYIVSTNEKMDRNSIVSSITRRININENSYIELCKFKTY